MRLPVESTLPARNALTPLPFCPVPPPNALDAVAGDDAAILSASERQTWMPLLAQSATRLCRIWSPVALRLCSPAMSAAVMVQSRTVPAQPSSVTPLAMLRVISRLHNASPRLFFKLTRAFAWSMSSVW